MPAITTYPVRSISLTPNAIPYTTMMQTSTLSSGAEPVATAADTVPTINTLSGSTAAPTITPSSSVPTVSIPSASSPTQDPAVVIVTTTYRPLYNTAPGTHTLTEWIPAMSTGTWLQGLGTFPGTGTGTGTGAGAATSSGTASYNFPSVTAGPEPTGEPQERRWLWGLL